MPFPRCRSIDLGLPDGWVHRNEEIGALFVEGYAKVVSATILVGVLNEISRIETHAFAA